MAQEVEWKDDFNIGVDIVDSAHRKLFSIVKRILQLKENEARNRWACIEGIKYFESYAIEHFRQEEEYMLSIGYEGYGVHKQLHDNLRDKTLPALKQNLERSDYSMESVEQFLGVCIAWLTGHIMIEDKAITGKVASKWPREQTGSVSRALQESLVLAVKEVFCQEARIFSDHYSGGSIDKSVTCFFVYDGPEERRVRIMITVESRLAVSAMEMMLNVKFEKIKQTISASIGLILQQFMRSIAGYFNISEGTYQLKKDALVSSAAMQKFFENEYPKYSILLNTDMGSLAFCLKTN